MVFFFFNGMLVFFKNQINMLLQLKEMQSLKCWYFYFSHEHVFPKSLNHLKTRPLLFLTKFDLFNQDEGLRGEMSYPNVTNLILLPVRTNHDLRILQLENVT